MEAVDNLEKKIIGLLKCNRLSVTLSLDDQVILEVSISSMAIGHWTRVISAMNKQRSVSRYITIMEICKAPTLRLKTLNRTDRSKGQCGLGGATFCAAHRTCNAKLKESL